jgi:hypothetical protein
MVRNLSKFIARHAIEFIRGIISKGRALLRQKCRGEIDGAGLMQHRVVAHYRKGGRERDHF